MIRLLVFWETEKMYRASPQSRQTGMSLGESLTLAGYRRKKDYPASHTLDRADSARVLVEVDGRGSSRACMLTAEGID